MLSNLQDQPNKQLAIEREALEEKERTLDCERKVLDDEKAKMSIYLQRKTAVSDVIELNVGGECMAAKRSTLTQPHGTLLEAMFSGRWETSLDRDSSGRVFLDFSPHVFRILLSHLRVLRDAKPDEWVKPPAVPEPYKVEFQSMIEFLELETFIFGACCVRPEALEMVPLKSNSGIVCNDCILQSNNVGHSVALGKTPLTKDASVAAWEVSVTQFKEGSWIFIGIIGCTNPATTSFTDRTSFGWACGTQVYAVGALQSQIVWQGWLQGDKATFYLDVEKPVIHMFHHRLQAVFSLALPSKAAAKHARVHINFHGRGTEVQIQAATRDDLRRFA
eukprot:TRINITY_DN58474_c0_g1_i1.p1 TRINITY_DN58474_c0_g1~~TRINITY_DN58474_c0_g1_i1.p1  ORF type:complete len:333 (+),score=39.11 TRINITY_DN58474_c0_g1_i1:114-1112(+)